MAVRRRRSRSGPRQRPGEAPPPPINGDPSRSSNVARRAGMQVRLSGAGSLKLGRQAIDRSQQSFGECPWPGRRPVALIPGPPRVDASPASRSARRRLGAAPRESVPFPGPTRKTRLTSNTATRSTCRLRFWPRWLAAARGPEWCGAGSRSSWIGFSSPDVSPPALVVGGQLPSASAISAGSGAAGKVMISSQARAPTRLVGDRLADQAPALRLGRRRTKCSLGERSSGCGRSRGCARPPPSGLTGEVQIVAVTRRAAAKRPGAVGLAFDYPPGESRSIISSSASPARSRGDRSPAPDRARSRRSGAPARRRRLDGPRDRDHRQRAPGHESRGARRRRAPAPSRSTPRSKRYDAVGSQVQAVARYGAPEVGLEVGALDQHRPLVCHRPPRSRTPPMTPASAIGTARRRRSPDPRRQLQGLAIEGEELLALLRPRARGPRSNPGARVEVERVERLAEFEQHQVRGTSTTLLMAPQARRPRAARRSHSGRRADPHAAHDAGHVAVAPCRSSISTSDVVGDRRRSPSGRQFRRRQAQLARRSARGPRARCPASRPSRPGSG